MVFTKYLTLLVKGGKGVGRECGLPREHLCHVNVHRVTLSVRNRA